MPPALLEPIIAAGVDTTGMLIGERTTASELIYDAQGNKEIRYPSMADPIKAEDIPQAYEGCRIIYVCPMDNDVLLADLAGVVARGQRSAVDLGGYGGVHMSKASRQAVPSLVNLACDVSAHFHIVKASDEDAAAIFGQHDLDEAAKKLLACGPEVVVITLGAKGALVYTAKARWHVPPVPGKVIDATGGGDAFMAGFLTEYLCSGDPLRAAQWGCATAICVIEQSGGVRLERMPTRQQVQERIDPCLPWPAGQPVLWPGTGGTR
jgi:sugar/nucleoside kinase (ribokinase family)